MVLVVDSVFTVAWFGRISARRAAGHSEVQISDAHRVPHCNSQQQERADKVILSVESGGPADVALRYSALVRWLCVAGFSRVCPSIFLSAGLGGNRRCNVSKKRIVAVRSKLHQSCDQRSVRDS